MDEEIFDLDPNEYYDDGEDYDEEDFDGEFDYDYPEDLGWDGGLEA